MAIFSISLLIYSFVSFSVSFCLVAFFASSLLVPCVGLTIVIRYGCFRSVCHIHLHVEKNRNTDRETDRNMYMETDRESGRMKKREERGKWRREGTARREGGTERNGRRQRIEEEVGMEA